MSASIVLLVSVTYFYYGAVLSFRLPNTTSLDKLISSVPTTLEPYDKRIVNGDKAYIEDYPHQVAYFVDSKYYCGGFIVSEEYVVTAAHCVFGVKPSQMELRVGSSRKSKGTLIEVDESIIHPEYDPVLIHNDVAVLKTAEPLEFNDVVQPIELPPKHRPMVPKTTYEVSGWGAEMTTAAVGYNPCVALDFTNIQVTKTNYTLTGNNILWITQSGVPCGTHELLRSSRTDSHRATKFDAIKTPDHLRAVELPVYDYGLCWFSYPSMLTDSQFCGGYMLGGEGTCRGDSGGAAVQDDMAVGIVSYGYNCAYPLFPTVYTDVAAPIIRDFISEETGV